VNLASLCHPERSEGSDLASGYGRRSFVASLLRMTGKSLRSSG
jgi:hypothetical protein